MPRLSSFEVVNELAERDVQCVFYQVEITDDYAIVSNQLPDSHLRTVV